MPQSIPVTSYRPKNFNSDQKKRLEHVINESIQTKDEIKTLQEGLKDAIKSVAEELDIKSTILSKAINIAFNNNYAGQEEEHYTIEEILKTVGRQ